MRKYIFVILILIICLPFARAEEELLDRVAAVVNDDVITQAELDAFLRPIYDDYSQQYSGPELMALIQEAREKILNQMIEDKLTYQEALTEKIEVSEDEIDAEFALFQKRLNGPANNIEAALAAEGLSMKAFREKLRKQVMIRKLQDKEIRSKVIVSPLEVEKFYQENPDKFKRPERVRVKSLTIKKSAEAREKGIADEQAKKRIDDLYEKVKQGEDFDKFVEDFSEDSHAKDEKPGEWIDKGSMIEPLDEALFSAPVGQMTGVVETPIGYHIFKIEEKEAAQTHSFEESRNQIMNYLYQVKSNERFKEWMQGLRRSAYISIR